MKQQITQQEGIQPKQRALKNLRPLEVQLVLAHSLLKLTLEGQKLKQGEISAQELDL